MTTACEWAGCRDVATGRADGFDMCARHLEEHYQQKRGGDAAADVKPRAAAVTPPQPGLLEQATAHQSARIRRLGEKISNDLATLRQLMARAADDERRKAQAERERLAARAEVERLENELRRARAALRGRPADEVPAAAEAKPKRQYSEESLARMRENAARMRERAAAKKAAEQAAEGAA